MKHYSSLLFGFFVIIIFPLNLIHAQYLEFNNQVPSEITVCENSGGFTVEFKNNFGKKIRNVLIIVSFPEGVEYTGNLTNSTPFLASEESITNPNQPWFSVSQLPKNKTVSFSFDGLATPGVNGNGPFFNHIKVYFQDKALNGTNQYYIDETDTDNYLIRQGKLEITNLSPLANSINIGQTFNREITIENTGDGSLASFQILDLHSADLEIQSVDIGNLNVAGNTITLADNDFQIIGNGNQAFDPGESITITENILAVGCNSTQSEIFARMECNNVIEDSSSEFPYTTINLPLPDLIVTPQPFFNSCVDGSSDEQRIVIANQGDGIAKQIEIDIFQYTQGAYDDINSKIDVNNIYYKLNNDAYQLISPTQVFNTANTGQYACLGNNAKGRFLLDLPDLGSGDSYTIRWNSTTCLPDYCGDVDLVGWKYDISYIDYCENQTFTSDGIGQLHQGKSLSLVNQYPSSIEDGGLEDYIFNLSTVNLELPEGNGAFVEAHFTIPEGLVLNNINNDLIFTKNTVNWSPSSLTYISGELVATYPLPAPWNLNGSTIRLALGLDCSASTPPVNDGNVDISLDLSYIMNSNCTNSSKVSLSCETVTTYLQCSLICSEGVEFDDFKVERTTFGLPDNDQNGIADVSGSLNMNNIALDRVMEGDEFKTTFSGTVRTSDNYPVFEFGYASSELSHGDYLELTGVTLSVKLALTGQTITCNSVDYISIVENDTLKTNFDISVLSLFQNGCTDFLTYQYTEGDIITLTPEYKVTGNIGAAVENLTINNEFYLSIVPDPQPSLQFSCGEQNGNISIIGYDYAIDGDESIEINSCDQRVGQNLYFGLGNCCDNTGWSDLFPFEHRNWSHANEAIVEIPAGYSIQNAFFRQISYGGALIQNHPVSTTNIGGNTFLLNLAQAYDSNGGSINLADESFTGKIFIDLINDCGLPQNNPQLLSWACNLKEVNILGGNLSTQLFGEDLLTYQRADIQIQTSNQTVQGIEKTVSWDLQIKNASLNVDAGQVWVNLNSETGTIEIEKVIDLSDNTEVYPNGEIYQLPAIPKNSSRLYQVIASYNDCSLDQLIVNAGYECNTYPVDMTNVFCDYSTFDLFVDPRPSQLEALMSTRSEENDLTSYNIVELEVASMGEAYLKDIIITLEAPASNGLLIQQDSAWIEYTLGSGYNNIQTPFLINNTYSFTDDVLHVDLYKNGLPGMSNTSANKFKLKLNVAFQGTYESGDYMLIKIDAKSTCGEQLPTIEYRLDPNQTYTPITGNGIDGGGNNWGVSWADYDKDGDPDLFVTNYDVDQPNELYQNDGDGTFTRVTTGPIATDLANSVGSSWGDYDNDGDLDLYVTNTIGFKNFLYRNNGDGTFLRIQDDPAVNYTGYSHGVSWGDYDNDGYLDLFITDFFATKFNLLYHNNGDGTFTQVTSSEVVTDANSSTSASWGDIDDDGDLDLFVANTNNENNLLYINDGNGSFTKVTTGPVVNDGGKSVGGSWGDIDNDGDYDLYVTNAGGQNNFLYLNNGDGTFVKNTTDASASSGGNSHGSSMGDYDNDGDLDLVVTNDAGENNQYFVNDGNGNFSAVDNRFSSDGGESFAVASADFDMDRDLDLYVVNHGNNPNFFYRNDRDISKSIVNYNQASINLQGVLSNAIAIGSKVSVMYIGNNGQEKWQTRQISAQTGGGLSSQNDILQHFGLGKASQIDSLVIEWPSGYIAEYGPQVTGSVLTFIEPSGAELTGTVYFDENGDGNFNNGEIILPNAEIVIQPGNITVYSDATGKYTVNLAPGNYTISQNPMVNWVPSGAGYSVNIINVNSNYSGYNFSNTPSTGQLLPDLEVALATTALRIGFEGLFAISYHNTGTAPGEDVILEVDFGPNIIPVNASIPWDNVMGTTYFWNLGQINIGEVNTIYVYDSVSVNAVIDDLSGVVGSISSSNNDLNLANNTTTDNSPFMGAFDPNDILVSPEGDIKRNEELTYKIRFQNVGNAEVEVVEIRNTLPEELDIQSLELGAVSHAYRFRIENGNELIWTFDNIYLPDSTFDEVNSHGFVTYRINPIEGATNGMEIKNNAAIYFDNNAPIITNTVISTILDVNFTERGKLMIYPNPMRGITTIEIIPKSLRLQNVEIKRLSIFDALGRLVYNRNDIGNYRLVINREKIQEGYYVVRAIGEDGNEYIGQLIVK